MPLYRIHRMNSHAQEQFRWAAHLSAEAVVRRNDYQPKGQRPADSDEDSQPWIEAPDPYALWLRLRQSPEELHPGDVLESQTGELLIYKFVGFEPARWWVPEPVHSVASGTESR